MTSNSLDRTLHAIADPTRRRILQTLKQAVAPPSSPPVRRVSRLPRSFEKSPSTPSRKASCLCAGDIQERVHLSQPTISHHMAILTKAGLVEEAKQGQWRWYRRNEAALRQVIKALRTKI